MPEPFADDIDETVTQRFQLVAMGDHGRHEMERPAAGLQFEALVEKRDVAAGRTPVRLGEQRGYAALPNPTAM